MKIHVYWESRTLDWGRGSRRKVSHFKANLFCKGIIFPRVINRQTVQGERCFMTSGKKILSLYAVKKKPKVRLWRVKLRIFPYFLTQTLIKSFAITSKLKLQFSFLGNGKCLCNLLRERKRERKRRERGRFYIWKYILYERTIKGDIAALYKRVEKHEVEIQKAEQSSQFVKSD